MIHLAAPFYPKDLRLLIQQLKRENKLREQPLFMQDLVLLLLIWVIYIGLFYFGKITITPISVLLALVLLIALEKTLINYSSKNIMLHSVGVVMEGIVYTEPVYERAGSDIFLSPTAKAWHFEYRVIDKRFPDSLKQKSYEIKNLSFKGLPYSLYKAGRELKVLVDPSNPDRNTPLFLKEHKSFSIIKNDQTQGEFP